MTKPKRKAKRKQKLKTQSKPWEQLGIGRSTYYADMKRARDAKAKYG
jgi:hypothetical protein